MAYAKKGGASRQKVDLDSIIETMLTEMREVTDSGKTQSEKTKLFKRIADKVKTSLHDDGRKKQGDKISLTTFRKYMTDARNAVKAAGYVHHSLNSKTAIAGTLPRVIRDFPEYAEMLETLRTEPAATLGARVHEILEAIRKDKANTAKRKGQAHEAIKGSKTVKPMKFDHEILYHLQLDTAQKDDFKELSSDALNKKHDNPVTLKHADIQAIIADGFKSESYSRAAFALALASGRRAIEILYTGSFKKTGDNTLMFTGQAKKRSGIDAGSFEIPLLVPADDFLQAFAAFRQTEEVQTIHSLYGGMEKNARNAAINSRSAKTLNESAKAAMGDNERTFKDSRSIYARIALDTLWDKSKTDEVAFITKIMGHDGDGTQATYRAISIDYKAPATRTAAAAITPKSAQLTTLPHDEKELRKISKELAGARAAVEAFVAANPKRAPMAIYHGLVEQWAAANPSKQITFSGLVKRDKGGIGGNRDSVKDYLSVISAELEAYNAKRKG